VRAAAIEIGLQHVGGDKQRVATIKPKVGMVMGAEMQKRNHKLNTRV